MSRDVAPLRRVALGWRRLERRLARRLPANVRGALWLILSCFCIASMAALVKALGARLDSFQLVFFRTFFGLLAALPFAVRSGIGVLRTRRFGLHLTRALAGTAAIMCGYFALTRIPLAEATAITFTTPLFLTLLAAVVLHETVRGYRWVATGFGFLGVLVMMRPGEGLLEVAALVALLGALCIATVRLLLKRLSTTEKPVTMIVYLGLIGTVISSVPAYWVWQTPTLFELSLLVLLGCVASISQVFMIRAYRVGEASALAPFEYVRLPFAAALGIWLFAEIPGLHTLFGIAIIVGSTLYIAHRER
ncbi:MAG: DMT family transporter [Pseudomonadota bacterium]